MMGDIPSEDQSIERSPVQTLHGQNADEDLAAYREEEESTNPMNTINATTTDSDNNNQSLMLSPTLGKRNECINASSALLGSSVGKRSKSSDLMTAVLQESSTADATKTDTTDNQQQLSTNGRQNNHSNNKGTTTTTINNNNGSFNLGESPTTRLDYLNQASFEKKADAKNDHHQNVDEKNNNASRRISMDDEKPPKNPPLMMNGTQSLPSDVDLLFYAENSQITKIALDAHAARAPSPAGGLTPQLLRVRSMVTLDGTEPGNLNLIDSMDGETFGSLEATDDEDALMTDEEEPYDNINNTHYNKQRESDSPVTKSKATSVDDVGVNHLADSRHSDGSVRSAEEQGGSPIANEQPRAKPPAKIKFGVYEAQGQRPYMEDRNIIIEDWQFECNGKMSSSTKIVNGERISDKQYIGVYDGHNGDWAASYAKDMMHKHLEKCAFIANGIDPSASIQEIETFETGVKKSLIRSFIDLDEEILDQTKDLNRRDGSTASVVLRVANHLFVAHAGDTRIVVGKRTVGLHEVRAKALTEDHKPSLPRERKRVYDEGGRVEFCGCWRVIAENRGRNVRAALAVSRAIGDIDFKRPENKGVTAVPDVARVQLDEDIENIIVATDGLWDVIGDQDAVRLCRSVLRGRFTEDACREAAEALTEEALERGSSDNVTVVVACFQHS